MVDKQPGTRRPWRRLLGRIALPVVSIAGLVLAVYAVERIGVSRVGHSLLSVDLLWAAVALLLMCTSMTLRAESWYAVLRAAGAGLRRRDALRATMIGVLISATLPGRLGQPARAVAPSPRARAAPPTSRLGGPRRWVATVVGTVFAQTLLNILALALLAAVALAGTGLFQGRSSGVALAFAVPIVIAGAVVAAPPLLRRLTSSRFGPVQRTARLLVSQIENVRRGLLVFRHLRPGVHAAAAQLSAWALQLLSCYTLLVAFGIQDQAGLDAAASVLLAVNVTAILPATPSNVGIFQAACVLVLAAYGVGKGEGLAYGIVLQAVEVGTAVILGVPALLSEGLHWRDLRQSADELAQEGP